MSDINFHNDDTDASSFDEEASRLKCLQFIYNYYRPDSNDVLRPIYPGITLDSCPPKIEKTINKLIYKHNYKFSVNYIKQR